MNFIGIIPAYCISFTLMACSSFTNPLAAAEADFRYALEGSGVYIFGYTGPSGHVEIPLTIGGRTVIRINNGTFRNRSDLTSVTIPIGITDIGDNSFHQCSGLKSVMFQSPSSATRIGNRAFAGCTLLEGVEIPTSVATIDDFAFYGCTALKTLKIADGVSSIGQYAFAYCEGIEELLFPPSVVTIGVGSFSGCNGLKDLIVPPTVTLLGSYSFYDCDGLISAKILANIAIINDALFWDCNNLESIEIPSSVTVIDTKAFMDCGRLVSVKIPSAVTRFGDNAFRRCAGITHFVFMGSFPTMGYSSLGELTNGCVFYYFDGAEGFPLPEYMGFISINMGVTTPVKTWLLSKGLSYNSNLQNDLNGDGVSLLMAYALNLDPNDNLRGKLPLPVITKNHMAISYYAGADGVTYKVETSVDLQNWSTADVLIRPPTASNIVTATIDIDRARRFMRLVVNY